MRIAVIGAGVAGMSSAWLLSQHHHVDLIEAEPQLGGHARTVDIVVDETPLAVDVGFMVFNHITYPNMVRMFERFGVAEQEADMSFSVHCDDPDVEWKGYDLNTFFAQRGNLASVSHWSLLLDIVRLSALADKYRNDTTLDDITLGEFLKRERFGGPFTERYIVPMVSAIWSAPPGEMLGFPAGTFIRFFDNHRMLRVTDLVNITKGTRWKSVRGGSRNYVGKLAAEVSGDTLTGTPVRSVKRLEEGVRVTLSDGSGREYDQVVMATHGGPTLGMIEDPTPAERSVLSAFPYQPNLCVLHTDDSFLPTRELARAAWNYYASECRLDADELSVTYYLNKLQQLQVATPVMVTVNPPHEVDPSRVLATFEFEHPLFDTAAVAMQKRIPEIQGVDRIWYAGAWQRYGFHEDGLWSAVRVAEGLGIRTPWADELDAGAEHVLEPAAAESEPGRVRTRVTEPEPDQPMASLATTSALYVGTVAHTRTRPKRNEFSYGIYFVYVDIDRLDELAGELVTFAHNGPGTVAVNDAEHGPRDGSPLRPWFDSVLARAGVDLGPGGRVMLLTFPRVGRWRFYPASFWYAFAGDGTLRAIMAEVNNTYGEHHDYLMHGGGASMKWTDKPEVDKVFHVSPFIEMDARYTFSFTEPGEELGVRILDTVAGKPLLLAKIELQRRPLTDEAVRPVIREYGPMSRRAAMLIGLQAARLVGKGIAFIPKPAPPAEDVTL